MSFTNPHKSLQNKLIYANTFVYHPTADFYAFMQKIKMDRMHIIYAKIYIKYISIIQYIKQISTNKVH